jgi:ribose-phosphate pyrophosphokinase
MKSPLLIPMPGNEAFTRTLVDELAADLGQIELRTFPDGESNLRFVSDVTGRSIALVCTIVQPDDKMLPLIFAAATAREIGADNVGLVAPYLAYMRQDRRFKPGEAVTSRQIALLLSNSFNWLVTVDPHLHRYSSLSEIYRIPTGVVTQHRLFPIGSRNTFRAH